VITVTQGFEVVDRVSRNPALDGEICARRILLINARP
jgi:hypothetical protein